jgi:hypothetical protein
MTHAQAIVLAGLLVIATTTEASGGTGEYELVWSSRHEVLAYHSCGCADDCWVAEVRDRKTRQRKARLRCDCEKAYFSLGARGTEKPYAASCEALNTERKPAAIRRAMQKLLRRPR